MNFRYAFRDQSIVHCSTHHTKHKMTTKTIFLIAVLSLAINYGVTNAISLNCIFQTMRTDMGVHYECRATLLLETRRIENIIAVYGTHETGKGNEDVTSLTIQSQKLEFFPTNINEFFPDISMIEFYNNSISSISNAHLIPLPNIWYLGLAHNRISALDSNLFSGLNSLEIIMLAVNEITSIDSNVFANLRPGSGIDLRNNTIRHVGHDLILPQNFFLGLKFNICVDTNFEAGDGNIEKIRFALLIKCPPSISLIESTLENRPNFIRDLMNRIAVLEGIIENNKLELPIDD